MAVTVSVPTILRTHTGGEKSVKASGATIAEVIEDLETRHSGIKGRLVKDGSLHRFINVYVNDEDVRFVGGLGATVHDGDNVTILPAVAGGTAARATEGSSNGPIRLAARRVG
jgi:sulfur-carrier protein